MLKDLKDEERAQLEDKMVVPILEMTAVSEQVDEMADSIEDQAAVSAVKQFIKMQG